MPGRKRTKHFSPMVTNLRTKSVTPTAHMRSKKSKPSRLGLENMRLEGEKKNDIVLRSVGVTHAAAHDVTNDNDMSKNKPMTILTRQKPDASCAKRNNT